MDIESRPLVVYATSVPALAGRLEAAITTAGGKAIAASTRQDFVTAVDFWFPVGALLDWALYTRHPDDWQKGIRRLKLRPHTRAVPLILLDAPPESAPESAPERPTEQPAEIDACWPASTEDAELVRWIEDLIIPPTVYPTGWDDSLTPNARKGIEEFNAREFYEQHEWLEHAWMEESRPIRAMYQGILQVGVGFYHIEEGNWPGALKMLRRGLPRLRALPPVCQGLDIAALRQAAEQIHREVTALGRDRLHEFDTSRFPAIRIVEDTPGHS